MQSKKTYLIVGASRGIGFEVVRQLLFYPNNIVIATARSTSSASQLWPLTGTANGQNLKILECDVSDEESIKMFAEQVRKLGRLGGVLDGGVIDCVVLNAGVLEYPNRISEINFSAFAHHLHTNAIGPLLTAQHLLNLSSPPPYTAAKPISPISPTFPTVPIHIHTLIFISSDSGSVQNFRSFEDGFGAYAASKAALNQGLRHLAAELYRKFREEAPVVLAIHPGEVMTDMAANADLGWDVEGIIGVEESVNCVLKVIREKGRGGSDEGGKSSSKKEGRKFEAGEATFWTWEGKRYPW